MVSMDIFRKFKYSLTRPNLANWVMVLFVTGISIGTGLIFPPAGIIAFGVTCGIYGYLLGSE
jgi:hypothetical protein